MAPLDLPDGRPPLAKEFSEAQLMHRIAMLLGGVGGSMRVVFVPGYGEQRCDCRPSLGDDGYQHKAACASNQPFKEAYWSVGAEYGTEAEDSPMAGAAIYGTGDTLRAALEQAGDDARLWRSDIKVGVEAEKEAHGG